MKRGYIYGKEKALAAVMATMLIASSLTACGGTKDTENMDASQTSSAQTQAVSLDGDKTTTVKTVKWEIMMLK